MRVVNIGVCLLNLAVVIIYSVVILHDLYSPFEFYKPLLVAFFAALLSLVASVFLLLQRIPLFIFFGLSSLCCILISEPFRAWQVLVCTFIAGCLIAYEQYKGK